MAASLVLVIKTSEAAPSNFLDAASSPRNTAIKLSGLLEACASGYSHASIDAYSSTSAPVAAAGTATLTYASIAANDTVTIGGTVLTCKASGAAAGTEFNKTTDATVTAANLAAAINANTTLSKYLVATSALGVVTVTCLQKGVIGNAIVLATSNAPGFALVAMAGGEGGASSAATTYSLGL